MKANISNLTKWILAFTPEKGDRIKEGFSKEYAVINPSNGDSVVLLRVYWAGTTCHCIAWFYGKDSYGNGYGEATGYGYCKESAAIAYAIKDAGIELSEPIDGRGESMVRQAAIAIGKKLTGKRKLILHVSHG